MEKLRLTNGSEYELVPNGLVDIENGLVIKIVVPDGAVLEDIRNEFKNAQNTQTFTVINQEGTAIRIDEGYTVLGNRIVMDTHYEVAATITVADEQPLQERKYATIVELKMFQENLNSKVDQCRADINYLMDEMHRVTNA